MFVEITQRVLHLGVSSDALECIMPAHAEKVSEIVQRSDLPLSRLEYSHDLDFPQASRNVTRTEV